MSSEPRADQRTLPTGEWGDWLAPAEAWERARQAWGPVLSAAHEVALTHAHGRILSGPVHAPLDSPLFDRASMDGYAVRTTDTAEAGDDAPARLAFAGEVPMGTESTVTVERGQAVWVATGSMLPYGADGVVMVERTSREGDVILVRQVVAPGENVVRRGDDLRAGELVLRAGHRLRPQDVAVLASMGVARVAVRERPRVAIISSGDELLAPGEPLGAGQIYDANSYAMAAQIEAWGGLPHIVPHVPDHPQEVRASLLQAAAESAIVLLSGGSSVGIKDLTATVIDDAGRPGVVVHGVAMRPGRPTVIGVVDGVLVIGIPGNPVSAMVACEVFARPAIEALLGLTPARVAGQTGDYATLARLATSVRSQVGRQDYVRVRLVPVEGDVTAHPVPGGSGIIRSMVDADGLLIVPPERAVLEEGETVEVRLF